VEKGDVLTHTNKLYILSGLPGVGKSSIAKSISTIFKATYIRIDTVEQGLRDLCDFDVQGEGYRLAYRIIADNLKVGNSVVVDSCNPWKLTRTEYENIAIKNDCEYINIEVICSDITEHRKRIEERVTDIPNLKLPCWSDVLNRDYEQWDKEHIIIDTAEKSVDDCVNELVDKIHKTKEIKEKLARSLTAETTELLPFLPYLLQDLWELGSSPSQIANLIKKHIPLAANLKILDLACGKGAVSIHIAKTINIKVDGYDILPEFIEFAKQKAIEMRVDELCDFYISDINETIKTVNGYDCVVFGAVGDVLGNPQETLCKLKQTIKPNGFIIIDESYLPDGCNNETISYQNYEYLLRQDWLNLFQECKLELIDENVSDGIENDSEKEMTAIRERAKELIAIHPNQKDLFEGYVQSQQNEYSDIEKNLVNVTWILRNISDENVFDTGN